MNRFSLISNLIVLICCCRGAHAALPQSPASVAQTILDKSGICGGIVVHLGCGNGELTVALRAGDPFTVQGLATDPSHVSQARERITAAGVNGAVSVALFSGGKLPYVDNLINLFVVEPPAAIPLDEMMRVLVPEGVACMRDGDQWVFKVKPRSSQMDQWTHFLHDASNNAVADDSLVGPPRSLQWVAPPLWLRSHETPSGIQSPVSAAGRLCYFFDEGLIGITDERLPDRWALLCRDAFNGKLLWRKPLDAWGWRAWSEAKYRGKDWTTLRAARTDVPADNQRRIVAEGDRVYVTLSYEAPVSILDAATGKLMTTVAETAGAREILVSDGVVLAYTQESSPDAARRRGQENRLAAQLVAASAQTGEVMWQTACGTIRPLTLAIDGGRIVYCSGREMVAIQLRSGKELWRNTPQQTNPRTLLSVDGVVVMCGAKFVAAYDAANGQLLWEKVVPPIGGAEGDDLYVIDGLVWRGMETVDEQRKVVGKSPHALVTGWDLRTGEEKKTIFVKNLRSPEHHHRCYRNKATTRYLISSLEGAEFLDLLKDEHSQDNWLRGSCRSGMMPCNGMLYVPPDQCFCEPGGKLLGYAAVTAKRTEALENVSNERRLERGPAYADVPSAASDSADDWPTLRHDAARSGATPSQVPADAAIRWRVELDGQLTAPVMAQRRVYVAQKDKHVVHALDAQTGQSLWQFTANGRVDSPPTLHNNLVLFGCCDGYVYCLRAGDGELVWRFLAAPRDQRIAYDDQIESTWPVHGSVLVDRGIVYFTAGRSTYLDGGIHVYGLDPLTGAIQYQTVLQGPFPSVEGSRDVGFYVLGANSDVLVSEGGFVYMRQKKMTRELNEVQVDVLSSKGAQDVGLHVFSTASLLDGSWYNRTFWMYSKRWPGFQLANQAPKTGQLLVVDDQNTYALRVFYRRNVHSPMFFPGREGYLLFADANSNEPQIVGEPGSRKPLEWLPQSDYSRARGDQMRSLDSEAFGLDKMIGYTRAEPPLWNCWLPVRVRGMVKAGTSLFVAGAPDVLDPADPAATFDGRTAARLVSLSAADGKVLHETDLPAPPVFDGLIAAGGQLFAALTDGSLVCLDRP